MVVLPLSILALAAGVYLLIKAKREYLGGIFSVLAWLVIALSLASAGVGGFKALHCHGCKMRHIEKQEIITKETADCCTMQNNTCPMLLEGMKMEGDSIICEPATCEKLMGKQACEKMRNERGRCIMSREECEKMCHGKDCCTLKNGTSKKEE